MWLNRILLSLVLATTLTAPTASAAVPGAEASFEVFMVVVAPADVADVRGLGYRYDDQAG